MDSWIMPKTINNLKKWDKMHLLFKTYVLQKLAEGNEKANHLMKKIFPITYLFQVIYLHYIKNTWKLLIKNAPFKKNGQAPK